MIGSNYCSACANIPQSPKEKKPQERTEHDSPNKRPGHPIPKTPLTLNLNPCPLFPDARKTPNEAGEPACCHRHHIVVQPRRVQIDNLEPEQLKAVMSQFEAQGFVMSEVFASDLCALISLSNFFCIPPALPPTP